MLNVLWVRGCEGSLDCPDTCRYIDEGGNPDSYTAEVFHRANRANQYSKGKSEALQAFR